MRAPFSKSVLAGAGAVLLMLTLPTVLNEARAQQEASAIEEIVVTSRKREENILEIPLSVQAFSSEELEAAGLRDLADLSSFTTGLDFQSQSSWQPGRYNSLIRFRGMAAPIENPSFQSGALFVDNVAMLSSAHAIPMADVERVEVIKGPQPVYFSRGTFGGAINYITADPGDEPRRRIVAEYGFQHSSYNFVGSVEGPLVEGKLAGRVTISLDKKGAMFSATDGGELGKERTDGVNATLVYTPSDNLRIRARASFNRLEDGPVNLP